MTDVKADQTQPAPVQPVPAQSAHANLAPAQPTSATPALSPAAGDAPPLLLASPATDAARILLDDIAAQLCNVPRLERAAITVGDADAVLAKRPTAHLLVVMQEPTFHVANSLQGGLSLDKAIEAWEHEVRRGISLVQRHRRTTSLVMGQAARAQPGALLELLGGRTGSPELASVQVGPRADSASSQAAVFLLTAELALQQSEQAQELRSKLYALSLPLEAVETDTEELLAGVRREARGGQKLLLQLQDRVKQQDTALANLNADRESQLRKQHDRITELEGSLKQQTGMLTAITKERDEKAQYVTELEAVKHKFDNLRGVHATEFERLRGETERLKESIEEVSAEGARHFQDVTRLTNKMAENETALAAAQKEAGELRSKLSEVDRQRGESETVVASARQERDELRSDVARLQAQAAENETALASARQQLGELRSKAGETDGLRNQLELLQTKLSAENEARKSGEAERDRHFGEVKRLTKALREQELAISEFFADKSKPSDSQTQPSAKRQGSGKRSWFGFGPKK